MVNNVVYSTGKTSQEKQDMRLDMDERVMDAATVSNKTKIDGATRAPDNLVCTAPSPKVTAVVTGSRGDTANTDTNT